MKIETVSVERFDKTHQIDEFCRPTGLVTYHQDQAEFADVSLFTRLDVSSSPRRGFNLRLEDGRVVTMYHVDTERRSEMFGGELDESDCDIVRWSFLVLPRQAVGHPDLINIQVFIWND